MSSMDVPADRPVQVPAAKVAVAKPTYISWVALALMTTASVASLRSAPTMAVYGLACVFLYIVPAIVFLLPTSLVVGRAGVGLEGRRLQLGERGHLASRWASWRSGASSR